MTMPGAALLTVIVLTGVAAATGRTAEVFGTMPAQLPLTMVAFWSG